MPLLWVLRTNLGFEVTSKDQCVPRCHSINCILELAKEYVLLLF